MAAKDGRSTFDMQIKLLMIGDSGVGKTCLLLRYANDSFSQTFITTIGIDFKIKTVQIDNHVVKLQIWDTAGQERFRSMAPMYYRGAHAAIVVYDITCQTSFKDMHTWLDELEHNMTQDLVVFVVGNKLDCEASRQVTRQDAMDYVASRLANRGEYCEVSAKEDQGIDELFVNIARRLVENKKDIEFTLKKRNSEYIRLNHDQTKSSYCCSSG